MQQSDYPPYEAGVLPPVKRGMSTGAKWAIGCSASAVVVLILICGGVYFGARYVIRKAEAVAREFEQQGYARVNGQMIDVTGPITQPTVYWGQVVNIRADSDSDVAIVAQSGMIDATIDGDVDFYGQALTIGPKGVVNGDVRIRTAQAVTVAGRVEGTVTGSYGAMNVTGKVVGASPATKAVPGSASKPAGP